MRILTTVLDVLALGGIVVGVGLEGLAASATVAGGIVAAGTSLALVRRQQDDA